MERDRFKTRTGFIIACIGSAVGMGNIWRFPIMVSKYGGMTFLIVYILFVILIASSGMIEEFALGRWAEAGPVGAFGKCTETKWGKRTIGSVIGAIPVIGADGSRDRLYGRDGLDFQILLHGHLWAAVRDGH